MSISGYPDYGQLSHRVGMIDTVLHSLNGAAIGKVLLQGKANTLYKIIYCQLIGTDNALDYLMLYYRRTSDASEMTIYYNKVVTPGAPYLIPTYFYIVGDDRLYLYIKAAAATDSWVQCYAMYEEFYIPDDFKMVRADE